MGIEFEASEDHENISIFEGFVYSLELLRNSKDAEILTVNIASNTKVLQKFEEACIDSGARLFIIGEPQADLYCPTLGGMKKVTNSQTTYRFGNSPFCNIGMLHVRIPVTDVCFMEVYLDIVEAKVPFLLDLNVLTQLKAHLDFEGDTMSSK